MVSPSAGCRLLLAERGRLRLETRRTCAAERGVARGAGGGLSTAFAYGTGTSKLYFGLAHRGDNGSTGWARTGASAVYPFLFKLSTAL